MLQIRSLLAAASLATMFVSHAVAQSPFVQSGERQFSRVLFFDEKDGKPSVPCQYSLQWSAPEWRGEHQKALDASPVGTRLRLGKDAWSVLDTNRPLVIGGTKVPAGIYYLALEKTAAKKLAMVLLDPVAIHKAQLDPFQTDQTKGGLVVPLEWTADQKEAESLTMSLTPDQAKPKESTWALSFGPHRLSARISAQF